jgi:uroporphyrinogen III methyltransferase/synthase
LEFPGVQIVAVADAGEVSAALLSLQSGDWLVFTSANGVQAFEEALSPKDRAEIGKFKVAVIGVRTAAAAEAADIRVAHIAEDSTAEGLGESLGRLVGSRSGPSSVKALLVQGRIAEEGLALQLKEYGVTTVSLVVYDTLVPVWSEQELELFVDVLFRAGAGQAGFDLVVFANSQAVRNIVGLVETRFPEHCSALLRSPVAAIGRKTAAVACEYGFTVALVPTRPSVSAVVEELRKFQAAV